jgi:OOP family OmpA-OmpF porin
MEIKIEFDFDSAEVRPQYKAALGDVAAFMGKHSSAVATIEGHTDSTGPESYNQGLSERRANSIATYLTDNKGVSANRLKTVGYGESRPVADNATREGRQRNRRVIAVIIESKPLFLLLADLRGGRGIAPWAALLHQTGSCRSGPRPRWLS